MPRRREVDDGRSSSNSSAGTIRSAVDAARLFAHRNAVAGTKRTLCMEKGRKRTVLGGGLLRQQKTRAMLKGRQKGVAADAGLVQGSKSGALLLMMLLLRIRWQRFWRALYVSSSRRSDRRTDKGETLAFHRPAARDGEGKIQSDNARPRGRRGLDCSEQRVHERRVAARLLSGNTGARDEQEAGEKA